MKAATVRKFENKILDAIVEVVAIAGADGAPGEIIHSALAQAGCTLEQYEKIMGQLVAEGRLSKRGQKYYAVMVVS